MTLPLFTFKRLVLCAALLMFSMGHGDGCCAGKEAVLGPPTGAMCPTPSTLTYASFGQPFMEKYCTRCHASDRRGDERNGAPLYHDFETLNGVLQVADHIDETAGAGPEATNDQMPPDGEMPTLAERRQLSEWIACGAPLMGASLK